MANICQDEIDFRLGQIQTIHVIMTELNKVLKLELDDLMYLIDVVWGDDAKNDT